MSEVSNEVVGSEVVSNEVVKAKRRPNVTDEAIMLAWEKGAIEGKTTSEVANELGMLKGSLVQRVQSLRKADVKLSKLTREKSAGGGAQKKDVAAVQARLEEIRKQLSATPENSETQQSQ
jgi:hypothetical protein